MLSARGVSRASAILPSFHLKQFITFTNPVLIHKFLQCEILQRVLHGKSAFSGLTLSTRRRVGNLTGGARPRRRSWHSDCAPSPKSPSSKSWKTGLIPRSPIQGVIAEFVPKREQELDS